MKRFIIFVKILALGTIFIGIFLFYKNVNSFFYKWIFLKLFNNMSYFPRSNEDIIFKFFIMEPMGIP